MNPVRTALLAFGSVVGTAAAQSPQWSSTETAPSTVEHLYYDGVRERAVGISTYTNGAWAFRNGRWFKWDAAAFPSGPGGVGSEVLLVGYDELRGQAVAIARTPGWIQLRTHVQVGSAWQPIWSPTTPPSVSYAGVAFDVAAGALTVFGGLNGSSWQPSNSTYRWNGTSWSAVATPNAPSPRYSPAMAYDRARSRMVLFGGHDGTTALGDTWEFDGATWSQVAAAGPQARTAQMVWDPAAQCVALLGGTSANYTHLSDAWNWNGVQWQARPALPQGTTGRGWSDAAGITLLGERGDTWRSTASGWSLQPGSGRSVAAWSPAMAYDPARGEVLLAGGYPVDATYAWRGRWTSVATNTGLGQRYDAAMASYGPGVVLFGGVLSPYGFVSDTWRWNGAAWQFTLPNNWPQARSRHRMTSTGTRALLHGGMGSMGPLDDLWEYDGVDWTQLTAPTAPPRRHDHGFAYDPVRQRAVVYGGYDRQVQLDDVWEWDGTQWHQAPPTVSPPPYSFELVFDPVRGKVVAPVQGEIYEWNGAAWTAVAASPTYDASAARFAYDVAGARLLSYGSSQQTWVYGPTPQIAERVSYGCGYSADLTLMGSPAPGEAPQFHVETAANMPLALAMGLVPTSLFVIPGCEQSLQPIASVFGVTAANGTWSLPLAIPTQSALRGLDVRAQAIVVDGGTSLGVSFSGGLRVVIGD